MSACDKILIWPAVLLVALIIVVHLVVWVVRRNRGQETVILVDTLEENEWGLSAAHDRWRRMDAKIEAVRQRDEDRGRRSE